MYHLLEGTFIGTLKNDKRIVAGIMMYNEGFLYEGQWKDDQRHGNGRLIDAEGDSYEG